MTSGPLRYMMYWILQQKYSGFLMIKQVSLMLEVNSVQGNGVANICLEMDSYVRSSYLAETQEKLQHMSLKRTENITLQN